MNISHCHNACNTVKYFPNFVPVGFTSFSRSNITVLLNIETSISICPRVKIFLSLALLRCVRYVTSKNVPEFGFIYFIFSVYYDVGKLAEFYDIE